MTDHDAEARARYIAAVRSHLAPLGKWGRPSAALTASTVKLIAEDGELYLKSCRKAHERTLEREGKARADQASAAEKDAREIVTLRREIKSQAAEIAEFEGVRIERDQLRETVADLEGQLAVLRHTPAPEPPAAPPATGAKPRSARARPAVSPQTAPDPPAHTPVTPKPSARRSGRSRAAE